MEKCLKIIIKSNAPIKQLESALNEKVVTTGKLEGTMQKVDSSEISLTVAGSKPDIDLLVDFCYQLQTKMKIQAIELVPQIYDQRLFRGSFRVI